MPLDRDAEAREGLVLYERSTQVCHIFQRSHFLRENGRRQMDWWRHWSYNFSCYNAQAYFASGYPLKAERRQEADMKYHAIILFFWSLRPHQLKDRVYRLLFH